MKNFARILNITTFDKLGQDKIKCKMCNFIVTDEPDKPLSVVRRMRDHILNTHPQKNLV